MTPLFRCPWCVQVERGVAAQAHLRKHIFRTHRKALLDVFNLLESFDTRKTPDPPRNVANPRCPLNREVSREGDT